MKAGFLGAAVLFTVAMAALSATAQEDIDRQRQEGLSQFREAGVPNPATIRNGATSLFQKPITEQSDEDLRNIARAANAYANYVGLIYKEYASY